MKKNAGKPTISVSGPRYVAFVATTVFLGVLLPLVWSPPVGSNRGPNDFFEYFGAALTFGSLLWFPISVLMVFPGQWLFRIASSRAAQQGAPLRLAVTLGTGAVAVVGSLGCVPLGAIADFHNFFGVYIALFAGGLLATFLAGQVILVPGVRIAAIHREIEPQ